MIDPITVLNSKNPPLLAVLINTPLFAGSVCNVILSEALCAVISPLAYKFTPPEAAGDVDFIPIAPPGLFNVIS